MEDKYEPTEVEHTIIGIDGQPMTFKSVETGEVHARRQADAEAALARINFARTARVCRVVCSNAHTLADVYATPDGYIIEVRQSDHVDAELRRLRRETSLDITREKKALTNAREYQMFLDPLMASDDRELEARCKCGGFELDRHAIRRAVAQGRPDLVVT